MAWFAIAVAELAASALLFAAALRLTSIVSIALAGYLISWAEVVALTELLSLAGRVSATGYLFGETLLLAVAYTTWEARGRSSLPRLRLESLRRHPLLACLLAVVGCAVAYQAFLVFATPPNNWDSMAYHLSRAAAWYQRQRVEYIPGVHSQRENAFPPNSEMGILYTFAFLRRDLVAAAPQLLAELAAVTAVYGIARRIGFKRPAALFAALLTATLTEIALQSVTTQNDLLVASFLAAAAFFVLGRNRRETALGGLAVGLALGTKLTAIFALPILALLALVALPRRMLVDALAWSVLGLGAVGAYGYVLNLAETGTPVGHAVETTTDLRPVVTARGTLSSIARMTYRFVDLSGFNLSRGSQEEVASWGRAVFDALAIPANPPESTTIPFKFEPYIRVDEDSSFFGPLGFFIVLPLALGFLVTWDLRQEHAVRGVLACAIPLYIVVLAFAYRYNTFLGRFMVTPVVLTMPLAGVLYRWRLAAVLAGLIGTFTLVMAHDNNYHAKPIGHHGAPPIWSLTRTQAQAVVRPALRDVLEGVERFVPLDAELGVSLANDDWDYPLYGPHLTRRLVPLSVRLDLLGVAERRRLQWVLIGDEPIPASRTGWDTAFFPVSGWTLFIHREAYPST